MRQELARIHGVWGRRWKPQLSPTDRVRVYVPVTERGKEGSERAERLNSQYLDSFGDLIGEIAPDRVVLILARHLRGCITPAG
jgi:hypothetical protein